MIQHEGPGWRFEKDSSKSNFPVLIGGENWAVELSENEWLSLRKVVCNLIDQYAQIKKTLMKEEQIFLEMERSPWWGCIDGNRESWSLRLILSGAGCKARGIEVFWPVPAAQAITSVMKIMWDS